MNIHGYNGNGVKFQYNQIETYILVEKKESPLDSIVTNLCPSKYTHRSPSKIWYIDLSSYQTPRSLDLWFLRTTADNSCVTERNNNNNNNIQLLMNISRIIPMKFHYNRIKNNIFTISWLQCQRSPFWKFQTLNAQIHTPKIIIVKFHYYQIKQDIFKFHGYHGNGGHF